MNKKAVLLFLALFLPVGIFLFLKFFGENEFQVDTLFVDTLPPSAGDCPPAQLPYHIADSIWLALSGEDQELLLVGVGDLSREAANEMGRLRREWQSLPITYVQLPSDSAYQKWKRCAFFLHDSLDLVLVDRERSIRGQYTAGQRKEVDRLLTEVDIILKQY